MQNARQGGARGKDKTIDHGDPNELLTLLPFLDRIANGIRKERQAFFAILNIASKPVYTVLAQEKTRERGDSMALIRWKPYRRMLALQNAMDRFFEDSFFEAPQWLNRMESELLVPVDMRETDETLVLNVELPGLKPEDVEISIRNNTLTLQGELKSEDERDRGDVHFKERRYGSFQRSIQLPTHIDTENVKAEFEDGVLHVTLPKSEEIKPRQIAITTKS